MMKLFRFLQQTNVFCAQRARMASTTSSPSLVGFVGVGNMGSLMTRNLLKNGHKVMVYDVNKAATNELAADGASVAESLAEVGDKCHRVFTMLPTPEIVLNVYKGSDGLLSRVAPSTVLIDSSTIDPSTAKEVHAAAAAKNIKFFDAPVAGAVPAAKAGTLTFMVGGDKSEIKQLLEPYLLSMGTSVFPCGPIGSGCVAKLCNNMMLAISMVGLSEAIHLGRNYGLDPKMVSAIINKGSGRCWSSEIYNPSPGVVETAPSSNEYKNGFRTDLLYKDLGLASKVSQEVRSPIPLGTLTHQIYRIMVNSGLFKDKDFSAVYKFLEGQSK